MRSIREWNLGRNKIDVELSLPLLTYSGHIVEHVIYKELWSEIQLKTLIKNDKDFDTFCWFQARYQEIDDNTLLSTSTAYNIIFDRKCSAQIDDNTL